MPDEQTLVADELELPAIEAEEPTSPDTLPTEDLQTEQQEGQEQAEELETIEFDGKQYQVPAALKGGFLMQADYTKKTQELAEQRRGLEDVANNVRQQAQAGAEEMQSRATLVAIDVALQNYAQTNWEELSTQDPIAAQQHWMRYQTLKEQRGQVASDLMQRHNQRTQRAQQETVRRFEETQEFAKKNIKGWSPELDLQIVEFARSQGATDQNIRDAMSPLVYQLLHMARIGAQALNRTIAPKPPSQNAKPLSMVGGKSNPSAGKSLADMDMDEYVAHRNAQAAKGR